MSYTKINSIHTQYRYDHFGPDVATNERFYLGYTVERTRTGDRNLNWKQQVLAHVSASTNMTGVFESVDSESGSGFLNYHDLFAPFKKWQMSYSGDIASYRYLPTVFHSNPILGLDAALSRAWGKAYKQIRKAQTSMSGGVFLGELKEVYHMLRHPAEGLRKAIRETYLNKLDRLKRRSPGKWSKALGQTWLESSFGWRPFINDLEDAALAYQELTSNNHQEFRHIHSIGKDDRLVGRLSNDSFPTKLDFFLIGNQKIWDEALVIIRGEVKRELVTTAMQKARLFGLNPAEFVPTVWELLPWSFLVDYFTNIGDILEAGATDTSKVSWVLQTSISIRKMEAYVVVDTAKNQALKGAKFDSAGGIPSSVKYQRRVVARIPASPVIPSLVFELPGSSIKSLNLLSLFAQANVLYPQDTSKLRGRTFR
jgi:hypothetical protein